MTRLYACKERPNPLFYLRLRGRFTTLGGRVCFSRRDHLIIVLYYYEQMTMREVGQALGISESRVSQRLESIVQCLRARMSFSGAAAEFV